MVKGKLSFAMQYKPKNTEALYRNVQKIAAKKTITSVLSGQPMIVLPTVPGWHCLPPI
jgi:hypothetical protein